MILVYPQVRLLKSVRTEDIFAAAPRFAVLAPADFDSER